MTYAILLRRITMSPEEVQLKALGLPSAGRSPTTQVPSFPLHTKLGELLLTFLLAFKSFLPGAL